MAPFHCGIFVPALLRLIADEFESVYHPGVPSPPPLQGGIKGGKSLQLTVMRSKRTPFTFCGQRLFYRDDIISRFCETTAAWTFG